jgi:hypothetical protein
VALTVCKRGAQLADRCVVELERFGHGRRRAMFALEVVALGGVGDALALDRRDAELVEEVARTPRARLGHGQA